MVLDWDNNILPVSVCVSNGGFPVGLQQIDCISWSHLGI